MKGALQRTDHLRRENSPNLLERLKKVVSSKSFVTSKKELLIKKIIGRETSFKKLKDFFFFFTYVQIKKDNERNGEKKTF